MFLECTRIIPNRFVDVSIDSVGFSNLTRIKLGDQAFEEANTFVLERMPSLQSLEMGKKCFYKVSRFSLSGCNESVE